MDSKERGKRGEKILELACEYLVDTWSHAAHHVASKLLDHAGIDRLLILKSGLACAINSKTSETGVRDHYDHLGRPWYQYIHPVLMTPEEIESVFEQENIKGVAARIKAKVLEAYKKIKESPLPE